MATRKSSLSRAAAEGSLGPTKQAVRESGLTSDARKDLLAAIDAMAKRGGISRDRALAAWYAATLLGVDEDEAIDAASVDGAEDGGCDFIYVDDDQESVYVLQGYISDRHDRAASMRKWNALVASIGAVKDPISFKHAGRPDIYERLSDIELLNYTLVFGLVTLAAKSDQISRAREAATRSNAYGASATFFYEDQESLYDKYLVAKAAERNVANDRIDFVGSVATVEGDFGQAVIGAVKASELARLHAAYGNQLFEGNVRLFIGQRKGGINEKIVETAQSRAGEFWALNNGITIVAESFEAQADTRYTLRHFSVVNGCQTTVSLSKAIERSAVARDAQVLVRIVAAKKAMLTDIVRFNNTQNPVKLSAVRLLDPIQEALRVAFGKISYLYAPKQEGAKLNKNPKRMDLDRVAQYLASASEETVLEAVAKKADLFDRSYKTIFPRGLRAERVFLAWLVAHEIDAERAQLLEACGDDQVMRTILGIHGTPWGIFVAHRLIERSGSDLSKLTLARMDTPEFSGALRKYAKKAMELYSEISVNTFDAEVTASDVRNELRVRPFLDKLKRTLNLRMAKAASWRLPRLSSV